MLTWAHLKPQVRLLPCLEVLAVESDQLPQWSAVGRVRPPEEHERCVLPVHWPMILHLNHCQELELIAHLVADVVNVVAQVVLSGRCEAGGQ